MYTGIYVRVVCVFFSFIVDARLVDVPVGVTQEGGHTKFVIHLPSVALALTFFARRIQQLIGLPKK